MPLVISFCVPVYNEEKERGHKDSYKGERRKGAQQSFQDQKSGQMGEIGQAE